MTRTEQATETLEADHSVPLVPLLGFGRWAVFGLIHLLASVLAYWPTALLWFGALAIGGRTGWWAGDPTANDGDEILALPVGLLGWGLVMGMTAWLVTWLVRPLRATPLVLVGWVLLVVVQVVAWSAQTLFLASR